MKKFNLIVTSLIFACFIFSCGGKEEEEIVLPVEFKNLSTDKEVSFTDTPILLNISGSNFSEAEFVFSDEAMSSKKVNDSIYEITATKALNGSVKVDLIAGEDVQTKSVNVEFLEHGVFNSNTVEGIRIDLDTSDRLLQVLGEPDLKLESTSGLSVFWYYSFGVVFTEVKANKRITLASVTARSRVVSSEGNTDVLVQPYPYLINELFDFSDSAGNTMDEIVNELKLPTITHIGGAFPDFIPSLKRELRAPTETSRGLYQYIYFYDRNNDHGMSVTFFANGIDEYKGEFISSIAFL